MTKELAPSYFMQLALAEADQAAAQGEVPVGAVLVHQNRVIAANHNRVEAQQRATAHAELLVLHMACGLLQRKYLPDCTLYVTLEPCPMCAMAIFWSQLGQLFFGASDPKRGYRCWHPNLLHPKTNWSAGCCAKESQAKLQLFFQKLRKSPKKATHQGSLLLEQ